MCYLSFASRHAGEVGGTTLPFDQVSVRCGRMSILLAIKAKYPKIQDILFHVDLTGRVSLSLVQQCHSFLKPEQKENFCSNLNVILQRP